MEEKTRPYSNNMYEYHELKRKRFDIEKEQVEKNSLIFIGDSITDIFDIKYFFPMYKTYNRGIGGDTSYGVIRRFKDNAIDLQPAIIVLLVGINDLLCGIPWNEVVQNYMTILYACNEDLPNTKVILPSILPINSKVFDDFKGDNNDIIKINDKIKELATLNDAKYVDLYTHFKNPRNNDMRDAYSDDGLHPNYTGFIKMAELINKAIAQVLKDDPTYKSICL